MDQLRYPVGRSPAAAGLTVIGPGVPVAGVASPLLTIGAGVASPSATSTTPR